MYYHSLAKAKKQEQAEGMPDVYALWMPDLAARILKKGRTATID